MTEPIDSTNKLFNQSFLNLSLIPHLTRWWAHSLFVLVVLAGYICTESTKPALAQERSNSVQCQTEYSKECFSPQEEWAWEQIVQGKPAEMNRFSQDSKPSCKLLNAGEPIKQSSRTLSHKFIEFVATHPRYEQGANKRLVHIECAVVDGRINLSNKEIQPQLTISDSLLKNGINIADAHFLRSFTIEKSSVTGAADSAGALFDRGLSLKENRHEKVILDNAQIRANLLVEDSTLTKTFSARVVDVGGDIFLRRTAFEGPVNLRGAKTAGILFAKDSQFKEEFIAFNLGAAGGIFLINITFSATVYLIGAKTAGILFAKDSQFKEEFRANDLDAAGNILLTNTTFKETVYLTGAKTAGILSAKNSQFKGEFIAHNLDAVDDMLLDNVSFGEQIKMVDAKIGKQLEIKDSVFKKKFIATYIEAGARILLTDTTFKETVYLVSAKTAGELSAKNSQFEGEFKANGLDAAGNIFLTNTTFKETVDLTGAKTADMLLANDSFEKQVYLGNAKIGKQLDIKDSVFEEEFIAANIEASAHILLTDTTFKETVDLTGAKTDTLQLVGSSFASEIDLRQTHIVNDFVLYDTKTKSDPLWKKEAQLMLNHAHAGALHARMPESWLIYDNNNRQTSTLLKRNLHGFTYDSLHLTEDNEIDDERITQLIEWAGGAMTTTMKTDHNKKKETPLDYLIKQLGYMIDYLIGKQCLALEWQKEKIIKYRPQPYTELAEKLHGMGAADQADRVLIAQSNHRYAKTQFPPVMAKIKCYFSSYGIDPFRPLHLFLFLIFLGALINLPFAYKSFYKKSGRSWIAWAPINFLLNLSRSLFHSFRNSIPIPGFLSYTKEAKPKPLIYLGWIYTQKILGLILLASAGYIAI